jgi:hypothetical protein
MFGGLNVTMDAESREISGIPPFILLTQIQPNAILKK